MAEELGKITKPSVEGYREGRNLIFIPLVFCPPGVPLEFVEKVNRYWDEVEAQITNLESKLGSVKTVYHELVPVGDQEGVKAIEGLNDGSHLLVRRRLEKEARLEAVEDPELLTEFMDWGRCIAVGLQNPKVLTKVYELYTEAQKKRNDDMVRRIDETLGEGECAILLMREGHRLQFPATIQVLYVSPPSLDEIERWLRDREKEAMARAEKGPRAQEDTQPEPGDEEA